MKVDTVVIVTFDTIGLKNSFEHFKTLVVHSLIFEIVVFVHVHEQSEEMGVSVAFDLVCLFLFIVISFSIVFIDVS